MKMTTVTTTDNPYDPFKQFDQWRNYDESKGYNTLAYLSRLVRVSPESTEIELEAANVAACEEIVRLNLTGNYKIVSIDDEELEDY